LYTNNAQVTAQEGQVHGAMLEDEHALGWAAVPQQGGDHPPDVVDPIRMTQGRYGNSNACRYPPYSACQPQSAT